MIPDFILDGIRRSPGTCHIGLFPYINVVFKDDALSLFSLENYKSHIIGKLKCICVIQ